MRKRRTSKIKDDDDYLIKQHPDIMIEALKEKFKFKFTDKDDIKKELESNHSQIKENEMNESDSMDSIKIGRLLKNHTRKEFNVRINDRNHKLNLTEKYILYNKENDDEFNYFIINNYVEISASKKIINEKFSGLIMLNDNSSFSKNIIKNLEIYFSKEYEYNRFIDYVKKI